MAKKISILCPVFNEGAVVPLFYQRLKPVISSLKVKYKVDLVFLDNASEDGTYDKILEIKKDWPSTYKKIILPNSPRIRRRGNHTRHGGVCVVHQRSP